ncbi:hypothetical protein [Dactylosporangium sp. NPDC005555]|uniref:hypothetical protein n=1 Tax=Dactylosporangium sp. NPDC005555 TaxID=3154889 RepID=UPI0033B7B948
MLLRDVMRVQLRRLPILYAGRRLDDDYVWDFVQSFVEHRWERAIPALLAEADDDESLTRLFHRTVYYWLVDQVRDTDRGSVLRRLQDLLMAEPTFEMVPAGQPGTGRWRMAGTVGSPWGGRLDDLVAAAYTVRVRAVRWSSETRRPPIAYTPDLITVVEAVMSAAGFASLELQQLVAVIVRRFPATLDAEPRTIDETHEFVPADAPTPETVFEERDDARAAASAADSVFAQLTEVERQLLLLIEDPAAVRAHLRCGRSTAYTRIGKLKALIRELAGNHDDPEQVVREVLTLCAR